MKKGLNNLLYTVPIAAASFLPLKEANGQIHNINMKEAEREMKGIQKPNELYVGVNYNDLDNSKPDGYGAGYSSRIRYRYNKSMCYCCITGSQ